jgi:hypothetical protein
MYDLSVNIYEKQSTAKLLKLIVEFLCCGKIGGPQQNNLGLPNKLKNPCYYLK